jgi:hypothetical protein
MRLILVGLVAFLGLSFAVSAQAEKRMFIVANDSDGYGIDRCLASGARCGAAAANAYCKTQDFAEAATYHKADRNDITGGGSTAAAGACRDGQCDVVAIVCTR